MRCLTVLDALGKKKAPLGYKGSVESVQSKLIDGEEIMFAMTDLITVFNADSGTKKASLTAVVCVTDQRLLVESGDFSFSIQISDITSIDSVKGILGSDDYSIKTRDYQFFLTRETKKKVEKIEQLNNFLSTKGISSKSGEQEQERESKGQFELESGTIKTLAGVEAYLKANGDTVSKRDIINFEHLLEHLYEDEVIHIAFTGVLEAETTDKRSTVTMNRESNSSADSTNAAFAITSERLIYARKTGTMGTLIMGGSYVKSIDLEEIRKVSSYSRLLLGSIVLESITNTIRIQHNKDFVTEMAEKIRRFIDTKKKEKRQANSTPIQVAPQVDVSEELRKYKQLETDGIITAEEFEAKKKELLGL